MASKWDTSGIDWVDIRNNRTEDVVYNLYQATYERDYAVWNTGTADQPNQFPVYPGNTPIGQNYKIRMEEAWQKIINIMKRWFSEDLSYFTYGRSGTRYKYYMATRCFVSAGYTPSTYPSFNLNTYPSSSPYNNSLSTCFLSDHLAGLDVLDLAIGGELDTLISYDLDFLRVADFKGRISINDLSAVYEILTTPMSCNVDTVPYDDVFNSFMLTIGNSNTYLIRREANTLIGSEPDINDAVNEMYGLSQSSLFTSDNFHYFRARKTGSSALAYNRPQYHEFNSTLENHFDDGLFTASDVKVSTFNFSDSNRRDDGGSNTDYGLFPTPAIFPEGIQRIENTFPDVAGGGQPLGLISTGQITSGVPILSTDTGKDETLSQYSLRFLNIDLPGFLKYYTETP